MCPPPNPMQMIQVGLTRFTCSACDQANKLCTQRARGSTTHPSHGVFLLCLLGTCLSQRQTLNFSSVIALPVDPHNAVPTVHWDTGHTEDFWRIPTFSSSSDLVMCLSLGPTPLCLCERRMRAGLVWAARIGPDCCGKSVPRGSVCELCVS